MDSDLGIVDRGAEVTRLGAMDLGAEGVGSADSVGKRGS
jgi:hypothetical protein